MQQIQEGFEAATDGGRFRKVIEDLDTIVEVFAKGGTYRSGSIKIVVEISDNGDRVTTTTINGAETSVVRDNVHRPRQRSEAVEEHPVE